MIRYCNFVVGKCEFFVGERYVAAEKLVYLLYGIFCHSQISPQVDIPRTNDDQFTSWQVHELNRGSSSTSWQVHDPTQEHQRDSQPQQLPAPRK